MTPRPFEKGNVMKLSPESEAIVRATAGVVAAHAEEITKVFYPAASNTVVFALMALVLLVRPAGLFGKAP